MTLTVERDGPVTTIIRSRTEARNAMDPASAEALTEALLEFDRADPQSVAVLWGAGGAFCAGFDLKYAASQLGQKDPMAPLNFPAGEGPVPRGPMGPTRLQLSKPVIAAIAGPAVAGGMELALWCDLRVMEQSAFMGVYCRRWGVPLIDGGTVRLPRIVGRGTALDIILTGRKVPAEECHRIGLCDRLVPDGESRAAAEALAHEIARFPQGCVRADRRSVLLQEGLSEMDGLKSEWACSAGMVEREGAAGAARFSSGKGRHGNFGDI
ncbi:MAG: crotonase/enoyl-CoA hydratase family protein [Alphaproteobacteria bacterium]|nr:MAG: crotonase/enoyl-CoA hydratase family protein [Alphaproteobacteria bacterium]